MNATSLAAAIDGQAEHISASITEQQFSADPTLEERFGARGRQKCTEDSRRHLAYLSSAAALESDALFADYIGWAKILLARLGLTDDDLAKNLVLLRNAVRTALGEELGDAAARVVDSGLRRLPELPSESKPWLTGDEPHADLARRYLELLLAGDRQGASALILEAVQKGVSVRDIYLYVFQRTQYEIGRRWQMNEVTVAEEHFCTAATQLIMSQLYPRIFATPRIGKRLVAACIGGDLHEIGVRMVADFFEMAGWDTYYLGANTPLDGIVRTVVERRADVLALSATMTYHVPAVAEVIRGIRQSMGKSTRILVGGYPFRVEPTLWRRVGADGSAADASEAVDCATELVSADARS
ncbi:MAG: B12-binding domain-containing protein [Gemmatimonadaceae bacterium]